MLYQWLSIVCLFMGGGGHILAVCFAAPALLRGNEEELKHLLWRFPIRAAILQFLAANILLNIGELWNRAPNNWESSMTMLVYIFAISILSIGIGYLYICTATAIRSIRTGAR